MSNALAIGCRCGVPVVMRAENVEHLIFSRLASASAPSLRSWVWRREAASLRQTEAEWCRASDLCLAISDEDREVLQSLAPTNRVVTVPAGSAISTEIPPVPRAVCEPHFLHLGNLDWPPRMEGLLWFLREVWPLARATIPDVRLSIAGKLSRAARKCIARLNPENVAILGYVPEVDPLAQNCAGLVVPMRSGGGIKIRVLTAWAKGWPVVGTRLMTEGLPALDGVNCLAADEPDALAERMRRLCCEPRLRAALVRAGYEVCNAQFSWSAIARRVIQEHQHCLGTHKAKPSVLGSGCLTECSR